MVKEIKYIAIHHFGGSANDRYKKSQNESLENINNAHKARWPNFPSQLKGSFIGYNAIIDAQGNWYQFRRIGEPTAAQFGHNEDTISIALAGNFTKFPNGTPVEKPTAEQMSTLKKICYALIMNRPDWIDFKMSEGVALNIKVSGIVPHRALQPDTDCFGDFLPDNWGRTLMRAEIEEKITLLTQLVSLYQKLLSLIQKKPIGGMKLPCGVINVKG